MFRALLLSLLLTQAVARPCCLCWEGDECWGPPMERNGLTLDAQGTTCGRLDLNTAYRFDESHPTCVDALDHRQACCDLSFTPTPVEVPDAERPLTNPYGIGRGPETICNVCVGESGDDLDWEKFPYPTTLYVVWAVLYIPGNPDCQELFWRGALGYIPNRLCYPLSLEMREPCGCPDGTTLVTVPQDPEQGGNAPEDTADPVIVTRTPPAPEDPLDDLARWGQQQARNDDSDALKYKLKKSFAAGASWADFLGNRRRHLKGSS